jgi:short-subunit dehydrogenase
MEMEMSTTSGLGTAIVTGASSGIGEVYAQRLADAGYDLVLVARRRAELEALAATIAARTDRKVDVIAADLAAADGQATVERRIVEDETITLLVNNAGLAARGPAPGSDASAIDTMLAVNVVALTRLAAAAATAFAARRRGTIVNIASVMAVITSGRVAAYAASKAYVLHLSRGLQETLAGTGVHVQAVLPGYTRTPLIDGLISTLPEEIVMDVEDLVDTALVGLDRGETITLPALPDIADWDAFEAARLKLTQNISRREPAARYRMAKAA